MLSVTVTPTKPVIVFLLRPSNDSVWTSFGVHSSGIFRPCEDAASSESPRGSVLPSFLQLWSSNHHRSSALFLERTQSLELSEVVEVAVDCTHVDGSRTANFACCLSPHYTHPQKISKVSTKFFKLSSSKPSLRQRQSNCLANNFTATSQAAITPKLINTTQQFEHDSSSASSGSRYGNFNNSCRRRNAIQKSHQRLPI